MCINHKKKEDINDINLIPVYALTYRNEFACTVPANSEEEAIEKAKTAQWELLDDFWPEYLEVDRLEYRLTE